VIDANRPMRSWMEFVSGQAGTLVSFTRRNIRKAYLTLGADVNEYFNLAPGSHTLTILDMHGS